MPKKTRCTLRELKPPLTAMLTELMASDLERRPFVIVEDEVTKRFVQFIRRYKPKTGELLFDVPKLNIVLESCPDPEAGANWAVTTLAAGFGLPGEAKMALWLDGDPSS
jgi:hypothetical protein